MKILPSEEFCLQTSLPLSEAVQLIAMSHEKRNKNAASSGGADDEWDGIDFQVQPAVQYRSSFLPVIMAKGESMLTGSRIQILMSLPLISYAFLSAIIVWGLVEGLALASDSSFVFDDSVYNTPKLIPIVAFIPLAALIIGAFKFEAYRSRRFLIKRLNAIVVN